MKIEIGKRYVRRDGKITDPIAIDGYKSPTGFPFICLKYKIYYSCSGWSGDMSMNGPPKDLISEYIEPTDLHEAPMKKQKRPFAVGDKIRFENEANITPSIGIIDQHYGHVMDVKIDHPKNSPFGVYRIVRVTPRQIISRIIKKPKRVPREFWIHIPEDNSTQSFVTGKPLAISKDTKEVIHVKEVFPKEKK